MAEVIPFKGIYYNTGKVSAQDVVAPPYDIITPEMRDSLYGRSPYNVVRIDAGRDEDGDSEKSKYDRAAEYLKKWLAEGILLKSPKPCFYAYEMVYSVSGEERRSKGFFGLVRLEELGKGIYPHEATHSKPKKDRLTLLRVAGANTSPIFSLYESRGKEASKVVEDIMKGKPSLEAGDDRGAIHRLWIIDSEADIKAISSDLSDKAIYIADGHHRYETALEYKNSQAGARGDEPFNFVLMFLANIADGGITILPTHRLVKAEGPITEKLTRYFNIEKLPAGADAVSAITGRSRTFGLYLPSGERYALSYRNDDLKDLNPVLRDLDVVILDEMILKRLLGATQIAYEMDPLVAEDAVSRGAYDAAFFLNPTGIEDVKEVAGASLRMPPKSTYFYPKLLTGVVINSLENS